MSSSRSISICATGVLVAAVIWLGLAGAVAQAAKNGDSNATAAFNRLKTLVGNWEATNQRGKVTTSYELVSNGTALAEHIYVPGQGEMLTVYYLDGNRLVLTHYCTAGNQPRMQAEVYDPSSNQLAFNFAGGGSLRDTNAGHMHSAVLKFASADAFTASWTFQENGKPRFVENMDYHRVK